MNIINSLIGKKVLFIDLETTGLPVSKGGCMQGGYHDYTDNTKYSESRIIQIGWCYYDPFSSDFKIDSDDVKSVLRKPWDFFEIKQEVVDVHGITYENIVENGILIKKILKGDFGNHVNECDFIVAYNAYFDFSILANEIHRTKNKEMFEKIMRLKDNNVICMAEITKMYLGLGYRCKQPIAYKKLLGKEPLFQHDARGDVMAMLEILKHMTSHPKGFDRAQNHTSYQGSSIWTRREEVDLLDMYTHKNKHIPYIAEKHKRTCVAIQMRLKKLNVLKKEDDSNRLFAISISCSQHHVINGNRWDSYTHQQQLAIFDQNDAMYREKINDIKLDRSVATKSDAMNPQMCCQAIFNTSENGIKFYKESMDKIYGTDIKVTEIFNYNEWEYYPEWVQENQEKDVVKVIRNPKTYRNTKKHQVLQ